jgi:hypothetical protein
MVRIPPITRTFPTVSTVRKMRTQPRNAVMKLRNASDTPPIYPVANAGDTTSIPMKENKV